MPKISIIKIIGLIGAVCSAIVLTSTGSYTEAVGVMMAALSSAELVRNA